MFENGYFNLGILKLAEIPWQGVLNFMGLDYGT